MDAGEAIDLLSRYREAKKNTKRLKDLLVKHGVIDKNEKVLLLKRMIYFKTQ